uniref:Oleosin n=1 Tax=Kalanchoe fedtschenkoi TaxID=63787 RepID=A0A7N1A4S5_KALFE
MASPNCDDFLKATAPFALGGSLLVLSSMALVGTVFGILVAAPLVVLFSPVLVPAVLTGAAIFTGVVASGGLAGASACWVYNYTNGKGPLGAAQMDCLIWRVRKAVQVLFRTPPQKEDAKAKLLVA